MKKSKSLRTQFILFMALLAFLQSASLVLVLYFSNVFFKLDAEAFRLFDTTTEARAQSFNTAAAELISSTAGIARDLNTRISAHAQSIGLTADTLYRDSEANAEACIMGADALFDIMARNIVSGAFFIIGAGNNQPGGSGIYPAVYIRDMAPSSQGGMEKYQLELGSTALSTHYGLATGISWDLELTMPAQLEDTSSAYKNPIVAARAAAGAEIERYGYWTLPQKFISTERETVTYTLPLLNAQGVPYGVIGFEISLTLFTQHYLPNVDLPYQNSFYAIARVEGDRVDMSWSIPSGPVAQVYLTHVAALEIEPISGSSFYQTSLEGLGQMYCAVKPLTIYSGNSPFYGESWSLISLVPQQALHETSTGVQRTLIPSIFITMLVALVAIVAIVLATTRKISGLSKYARSLSPRMDIHFTPTGVKEIDDLISAVEMLNKSVLSAAKTTSKILDLTTLPIGGFEVFDTTGDVVLTEFLFTLLDIEPGREVSRAQWDALFARLTESPLSGVEDTYRYSRGSGDTCWLRILTAPTEAGRVGVILDVTADMEENRRLAQELDYDGLTRLLNRNAFKRDAHAMIQQAPDRVGVMIFADLDNLKYMNDTFGHDVGDRFIIRAGEMFRTFQSIGGVVSRISGDEFAIYVHDYLSLGALRQAVMEQFDAMASFSLMTPDGQTQKIRLSAGMAFYPQDSNNVTDLLKLADFAMYEAKHHNKGSVYEFSQETYLSKAYLLENREAINRLLDERLIRFVFQPIVDLKTGEIFAYEALMRPLLSNFKSPLEILAVAETQSKLAQLEHVVLFKAFEYLDENIQALGSAKLFINSISSQILNPEARDRLEQLYAHLFDRIVVEITESESESPQKLADKMSFMRKNNIMVAVDDFGSGYSNEIRVLKMSPDVIKVDIALISDIDTNVDKQHLVANLLSFCKPKGIRVVAEGVETAAELAMVSALGVDLVQGYYVMRPQPEPTALPDSVRDEIIALGSRRAQA